MTKSIYFTRRALMKQFFNEICTKLAKDNDNYRNVLFTTEHSQLVLMSVNPHDDIPKEIHAVDQIIIIVEGSGEAIIDETTTPLQKDSVLIVPAGTQHWIKNTSDKALKLYTFYAPPEHAPDLVEKTKEED